jgi:hypothetical protein
MARHVKVNKQNILWLEIHVQKITTTYSLYLLTSALVVQIM